ncbi:MAG: NAD(P)/FAD-dependent oxidoreductase [Bacteroidota bacterium]
MNTVAADIVIIGAGLTGLLTAFRLKDHGLEVKIVDARNRIGGRIYTKYSDQFAPTEMGATWLGQKHTALVELLEELGLPTFVQQLGSRAIYEAISTSPHQLVTLPPNTDPSYRIKEGSSALINTLAEKLDQRDIYLNQVVEGIIEEGGDLKVSTSNLQFKAAKVVSTLPPVLFAQSITVSPRLPKALIEVAKQTHTWMGDSIKVSLAYESPFWREEKWSGTIVSNVGPIPEMYDHADFTDSRFALKGFFNGSYYSVSKAERLEMVLTQLQKYYGNQVRDFLTYEELVWRNEPFTYSPYEQHVLPHQNNGHTVFREAYLGGKLFIAGSETAPAFPGYMDGAVRSGEFVAQTILNNL